MPRKGSPYGPAYQAVRAAQLGLPCEMRLVCDGDPANSTDHDPPLARHLHIEGSGCCRLRPGCLRCQRRQAQELAGQTAKFKALGLPPPMIDVYQPSRVWA
jgi:hypothetical protein